MVTHHGIVDHALGAIETGLERGRETLDALVSNGSRAMRVVDSAVASRQRSRPSPWLAPMWFGMGLALGLASNFAGRRRGTSEPQEDGRRLRDLMVTDVQTIEQGATAVDAAELMRLKNVGVLPVVDQGRVVGIVTDRDLVVRLLAKRGADPATIPVMDCATRNPVLARTDWMPERALLVMAEQQIGRLPVVDEQGRLAGMITLGSLALRSRRPDATLAAARNVSRRSAREKVA